MAREFSDVKPAKAYLIDAIAEAAASVGDPLSENDRAMLWFSEIHPDPSAPHPEWVEDSDAWEKRMTEHADRARRKAGAVWQLEDWRNAERKVRTEDHYLLIILGESGEGAGRRFLKLFGIAVLASAVILALLMLFWDHLM